MSAIETKAKPHESLADRIWKVRPVLTLAVVSAVFAATAVLAALQAAH